MSLSRPSTAGGPSTVASWSTRRGASSHWKLTVVKLKPNSHRFEVLPRRWVVEWTLTWLTQCRRPSKDYEEHTLSSEGWAYIAIVHLSLKRLQPACLNPFVTHPVRLDIWCFWPVCGSKGVPGPGRCLSRLVFERFCAGFPTMA